MCRIKRKTTESILLKTKTAYHASQPSIDTRTFCITAQIQISFQVRDHARFYDLLTGSYESRIRRSSLIPTVANGTAKVQQAKIDALNINGINLNGDEKIVKKTQAEVHSRPH